MHETVDFLQRHHAGHYKVYNLCIEPDFCYSQDKILGPVVRYPLYDGQVGVTCEHLAHDMAGMETTWAFVSHLAIRRCVAIEQYLTRTWS